MESAKIPHHHHHHNHHHHHQVVHQNQLLGSSTINLDYYSPAYGAPSPHVWTSNNSILNGTNGSFDSSANITEASLRSRTPRFDEHHENILVPSLSVGSITQDLSFSWLLANGAGNHIQSAPESQISRIKQQISNHSCPNLSEMITSSPSSSIEDVQLEPSSYRENDPNVKLLLSTLSSSGARNRFQSCSPEELMLSAPKRGTFSQIHPTINISNYSNQSSLANSAGSFDVANTRPLDLFNPSMSLQDHQIGRIPRNVHNPKYGYDYEKPSISIQQQSLESSNNTNPFSRNGVGEEKSSNSDDSEPKAPPPRPQQATKRPRSESNRASCPPLKVRKEKLGDRIAALQQLVSPFGKTDTASVLMEAIGYIKFLQNQVETLSVPYLKPSRNKITRPVQRGQEELPERKQNLRSRGLCLVPMSCLSYVTDTGGSIWPPPPNFTGGGGT